MILRKLRLERFGRFTQGQWEFAPGLTVVRGPNEAGKSTMREAIVRLLLPDRKVDTQDSSFLALRTWGTDRRFVIEGEFEAAGAAWSLVRDFDAERVALICEGTGETLTEEPAVAERIWELLGVASREVYETTACLAQQEFVRLEAGERVAELLQQTVVGAGAETGAQSVLSELDARIRALSRGLDRHAKSPGPVRAEMDRIDALDEEIARVRPIVEHAGEAVDRIDRARERIARIAEELAQARRILERAEERREVEEKLEEVGAQFRALEGRARDARDLQQRIAAADEKLAGLPEVTREQVEGVAKLVDAAELAEEAVSPAQEAAQESVDGTQAAEEAVAARETEMPDEGMVERVRSLEREIGDLQEAATRAEALAESAEEDLASARKAGSTQRAWLVAAGVLIVAGAGLALGLGEQWAWILSGVGLVVGVMGSLRGPRIAVDEAERRHEEAVAAAREAREALSAARSELADVLARLDTDSGEAAATELNAAREAVAGARETLAAARAREQEARAHADRARQQAEITAARLAHRLEQLGVETKDDYLTTAREVFELREEQAELRARLKGVLGDDTLPELENQLSDLAGERMGLQQKLETEELAFAGLDAAGFEELQSRIGALEAERAQLREEIEAQQGAASHPEADAEHLRRLQEQRAAAAERLERVRERLEATELARELLAQAHEETLEGAIDVLEPRSSELLAAITDGRYCAVEFDHTTLEPSVHSAERGCAVDPDDQLSCATREQVYLAARLALTELLWPEDSPPIMLDDPFVNFDAHRREEAVRIVQRVAQSRQVLLFTCHDLYDEAADRVLELAAP
jgi:DNA repair exonuclease SbcCD ATPase subunit